MEISATPAGVDVHAGAIQVSVLAAGAARAEEWRLEHEPRAVRRPARRLKKRGAPGSLVACYEARPTGFALQRRPADARDAPQGRHAAPLRELSVRPTLAGVVGEACSRFRELSARPVHAVATTRSCSRRVRRHLRARDVRGKAAGDPERTRKPLSPRQRRSIRRLERDHHRRLDAFRPQPSSR